MVLPHSFRRHKGGAFNATVPYSTIRAVCSDGQGSKANLYCNGTAQLKIQVYYDLNNATFKSVGLCSRATVTSTDDAPGNHPLPTGYTVTQLASDQTQDYEACDGNYTFTPQNMEGKTLAEFVLVTTDPAVYDAEGASIDKDFMAFVDNYVENSNGSAKADQTIYSDMSTDTTQLSSGVEVSVKWQPKIEINHSRISSEELLVWEFNDGSVYNVTADFGSHSNYTLNMKTHDHYVASSDGTKVAATSHEGFTMTNGFQLVFFKSTSDKWHCWFRGMMYHAELNQEYFDIKLEKEYHYKCHFEKSGPAIMSFAAYYSMVDEGTLLTAVDNTNVTDKIVVNVVDIYGRKSVAEYYFDSTASPADGTKAGFTSTCVDQKP